jgi:[ribosomal protein S5]-alanine N-acetyltransferase
MRHGEQFQRRQRRTFKAINAVDLRKPESLPHDCLARMLHCNMIITETHRLLLRHFHIVDGDAMDRVFGDPQVMKFGRGTQSPEWVRGWLRGCLEDYHQTWGFGLWAVVEKGSREVIGFCGLSRFDDVGGHPETEIGYRLARTHWGRGYATEAACAVRDYAFNTLCLPRLISIIDPTNTASIRVAEKVGLKFEKDVIFQGFPDRVYSIARPGENR